MKNIHRRENACAVLRWEEQHANDCHMKGLETQSIKNKVSWYTVGITE